MNNVDFYENKVKKGRRRSIIYGSASAIAAGAGLGLASRCGVISTPAIVSYVASFGFMWMTLHVRRNSNRYEERAYLSNKEPNGVGNGQRTWEVPTPHRRRSQ